MNEFCGLINEKNEHYTNIIGMTNEHFISLKSNAEN